MFCNMNDESIYHLFVHCICTKLFWSDFKVFFKEIFGIDITLEEYIFFYDKPLEKNICFVLNLFHCVW